MDRSKLLETLGIVDPALADNDLIPVLTHFWFTGKEVIAYNDVISISAPFKTNFKGAVRGSLLKGLLGKYDSAEVGFESDGDGLRVSGGKRASSVLAVMSQDNFLFTFPNTSDLSELEVDAAGLIAAIDVCLQSLGSHISEPERRGITMLPGKSKTLDLFSTDSVTLSYSVLNTKSSHDIEDSITLSELFCRVLVKLLKKEKGSDFNLYLSDDFSMAVFGSGIKLFGRLVDDPSPPNFRSAVNRFLPKRADNSSIGIPEDMDAILSRAFLLVSKALEPETTLKIFQTSKGKTRLRVRAVSELGEFQETVEIDDHPKVTVKVDLSRLRDCDFQTFDKFFVDKKCLMFSRGRDMYHLVSVLS